MLIPISQLKDMSLLSLHTGQELARLGEPIINPHTLQVLGFFLEGRRLDFSPAVILTNDIREISRMGAIVDSVDKIAKPDDIVRLKQILDYDFILMGLKVVSNNKKKIGNVEDYLIDLSNFMVQHILVKPRLSNRLSIAQHTIARQQIEELDNERIVVK